MPEPGQMIPIFEYKGVQYVFLSAYSELAAELSELRELHKKELFAKDEKLAAYVEADDDAYTADKSVLEAKIESLEKLVARSAMRDLSGNTWPHASTKPATCGECAWSGTPRPASENPDIMVTYCRRLMWGGIWTAYPLTTENLRLTIGLTRCDTPACPAAVAKEAK